MNATSLPAVPPRGEHRASSAPGTVRAAWIVALRELTEHVTSVRFLVIALLAVGLTPVAAYVGARDYRARAARYDRLVAERQELRAGPAGAAVSGDDRSYTPENELAVLRAIRRPAPLSVLVRGLDGALPDYVDFTSTGIELGPRTSRARRLSDVLGQLDVEFLVRVVLGLLAILLAFDAVAGEKELGTLRAVLSQPISRPAFLAGKLIGGALTLLVPLALAFLLALLAARLFGVDLLGADTLAAVALLGAAAALYLVCFHALGLLVSSLVTSQKTALVALLVTWVVAVLAIPPLSTLTARAVTSVPAPRTIEERKRALDEDLRRDAGTAMGAVYREATGRPEGHMNTGDFTEHGDAIRRGIAPIVVDYVNERRRLLGEIERDVERREARQAAVARAIMALSPAAAFAGAAAALAGTGDADQRAWKAAVQRYQGRLGDVLFGDPPWVTIHNRGTATFPRREPPSIAELPTFMPPPANAAAAAARALPALGLLALYTGLFIAAGFLAFARYDVR